MTAIWIVILICLFTSVLQCVVLNELESMADEMEDMFLLSCFGNDRLSKLQKLADEEMCEYTDLNGQSKLRRLERIAKMRKVADEEKNSEDNKTEQGE